jgi:uncharacterized repeat protein (TIGR03803 family)
MTRHQRTTHSILATSLPIGTIRLILAAIFAAAIVQVPASQAQTITVLHSFNSGSDGSGSNPVAGVTMDRAGNLYGTSNGGGYPSTVFKMSHAGSGWIFNTLYTFNHPNDPTDVYAGVTFGPDGRLYGTSYAGAEFNLGAVFALQPLATPCKSVSCPWTLTILHNFDGSDGTHPDLGSLVFDSAGNVYGTTYAGGAHVRGTVFKLARSNGWAESVLYSFSGGDDGGSPYNGVAFDSAGNLYGTTSVGGNSGYGTVYELSPSGSGWTETTLYSFSGGADGGAPIGSVAVDAQGNLYGTASSGGTGAGTAWELSPSNGGWAFTLLHSFSGRTTPGPTATPTLDAAGNIYGTSPYTGEDEFGEAFKMTPTGGGWTYTSYHFDLSDGQHPECSVALDANGNLYGTAPFGGAGDSGVVWEITP